jgi:hypothetical protein
MMLKDDVPIEVMDELKALTKERDELTENFGKYANALQSINDIRDSIVGSQKVNWSEHIYPLVAALESAGYAGLVYPDAKAKFVSILERAENAEADNKRLMKTLEKIINLGAMADGVASEGRSDNLIIMFGNVVGLAEQALIDTAGKGD